MFISTHLSLLLKWTDTYFVLRVFIDPVTTNTTAINAWNFVHAILLQSKFNGHTTTAPSISSQACLVTHTARMNHSNAISFITWLVMSTIWNVIHTRRNSYADISASWCGLNRLLFGIRISWIDCSIDCGASLVEWSIFATRFNMNSDIFLNSHKFTGLYNIFNPLNEYNCGTSCKFVTVIVPVPRFKQSLSF
jgi:hypothetical protein